MASSPPGGVKRPDKSNATRSGADGAAGKRCNQENQGSLQLRLAKKIISRLRKIDSNVFAIKIDRKSLSAVV